jgi:TonB family protein
MAPESCSACGAPISPGADVAGLCPACLLSRATDPSTPDDRLHLLLLPSGTAIGPFRITRFLGRGGMAAVYEAHEDRLKRQVAVKVLAPEFLHDRKFAHDFQEEARLLARLEHPNIVPIYAAGVDDGMPWLSMRLMPGGTIERILDGRMTLERALPILRSVAAALDYAHARGVIHRDVKPSNILLNEAGHVCMADFGLARLMTRSPAVTTRGLIVGTPQYMAPEQALDEPLDHRCDLYSLGVVAYEMLCGVRPFDGASAMAVITKHISERVPAPSSYGVSRATAHVLLKALEKKPAQRWPTAAALVNALEASGQKTVPWKTVGVGASAAAAVAIYMGMRPPSGSSGFPPAAVATTSVMATSTSSMVVQSGPKVGSPPPSTSAPVKGETTGVSRIRPTTTVSPKASVPVAVPPTTTSMNAVSSSTSSEITTSIPPTTSLVPTTVSPDVIFPPNRTYGPEPMYPQIARAAKLEGDVLLEVRVDIGGRVTDARVLKSDNKIFEDAATKAVLQYRYNPQRRNGQPEPAIVQEKVSFRLAQ